MARPGQGTALRGRWLWLFPASYAVHIAEEGLAGESHPSRRDSNGFGG
jgi:hypothetical protein